MVKPLFDTNVLIDFLSGVEQARREFQRYEDKAISIITWMEVLVGARPSTAQVTRAFLQDFEIIQLDGPIAEAAVTLRRNHRIRLPDAVIWATADIRGRLLVTRNEKDFPSDAPGVRIPYRL